MPDRSPNRRHILKAVAALGALAPLPLWANPMPSVEEVAFDPDIPVLGNADGDVTVVEFTDYQCPYCKLSFLQLSEVMKEDTGIRLVLRDWPIFGEVSRNAALLTLAANSQGRYADAVQTLMTAREKLTFRSTANLLDEAGVDVERARGDLQARQDVLVGVLQRNEAQASALQLQGTPGFLIGKALYKRGMTSDDFRKAIARARA
ncbi:MULTISPECIES: DsbA family protein [Aminobacter]|uniref:DSBA oxidoreductase n=2 Tax=Aminobacter TaxID=31988 RepID=A0AAC8YT64_AMIAI|nr:MULTISPECIES: DsbA family protein [Aminobacter]AMS43131.1 DSBA oxidoreductase [Aminobacter aminovorans]MBA8905442.1 protein-disulfide isomerase [Aminobacter ciceronei]MBA9019258.1 protein-disulfide isomerase [Aminobacter ciceronei]MBB3708566.1 protein-disulfide isomerase [Aminobacter aminovorans]